ncbi:antibiotic biosynthesis monooxygenase family protein [Litoreibacter janthinus]|uniref:Antibiotic biosynthesis monooxygenase n=1 Tax=Litoreibacter janthinus TaxID=670154 RepID=A0A1I6HHG2_9RHOB|nr:hypothetical protein [Litoreibacter janthinus]SFR53818.1 hypothetical protein SAMN04488002_3009 [Litoreibacter janthinus]
MTINTGPQVAEIVTFTLKDGTDQSAFLATLRATQSWVDGMPGFLGRQVTRGADGRWTDNILWANAACAKAAQDSFGRQTFAPDMGEALNHETLEMRHETVFMAAP